MPLVKKLVQTALVCIAASTFAFSPLTAQDLKITYKTKVGAMLMSQKGTEVEYHSKHYKRTNDLNEKRDTLIDYRDFVSYEIDHKYKILRWTTLEYALKAKELTATDLKEAMDADKDGKEREKLEKYLGKKTEASIKRTGTEVIAGRNCDKWEISAGKFTCKMSVDPSLVPPTPLDVLEKAAQLEFNDILANPILGNMGKLFEAISKIKGIQLKSEIVMPIGPITIKMLREATAVTLGPIPDSAFELPKGYKEEDAGKKELEELEKARKERQAKKKK